ncbi:hypothetical protein SKAU_G00136330, partial [Synaphobranchus kaupii]
MRFNSDYSGPSPSHPEFADCSSYAPHPEFADCFGPVPPLVYPPDFTQPESQMHHPAPFELMIELIIELTITIQSTFSLNRAGQRSMGTPSLARFLPRFLPTGEFFSRHCSVFFFSPLPGSFLPHFAGWGLRPGFLLNFPSVSL